MRRCQENVVIRDVLKLFRINGAFCCVCKVSWFMQFRQLRYFVKIVEAGSFSRAATLIHVAQPALSQQIHELEDRLGVTLLRRSARGVNPTAAGELLFREATSILHQLDQLPTVVRSGSGEAEGVVRVGLASSMAPILIGPLLGQVRTTLPKVNLKISDDDSGSLEAGVAASNLDMAIVYEDEFVSTFSRRPIFRQRLYLVGSQPFYVKDASSASLEQIAKLPLILPGLPNGRRSLIDRAFADLGRAPMSSPKPTRSPANYLQCALGLPTPSCRSRIVRRLGAVDSSSRCWSSRRFFSPVR